VAQKYTLYYRTIGIFWGVICRRKLQTEKQFIDSIWANEQKKLN